jgi:hypothetical protein
MCTSQLDDTDVCKGACEDCCLKTTCGNAPPIPHAQFVNGNGENTPVNESLTYWCDDGYITSPGKCDESLFEKNTDYWLPDNQNIFATRQYNEGINEQWRDKFSGGETYYWGRVPTPKACCDLCLANEKCSSFAYNSDRVPDFEPRSGSGSQACYLKSGFKPGRRDKNGVVSGYPMGTLKVTCGSDGQFHWSGSCVKK